MRYREAAMLLKNVGIESAEYDAAEIFCRFGGVSRAALKFEKDRDIDDARLIEAVKRRCAREPLQYILGEWDFYGRSFFVNENCLCPRADTELLVEQTLSYLPLGARVLELCTGSGCIPISLCAERADITAIGTDIFSEALKLAERNAERHGVGGRISFRLSDVFSGYGELESEELFDAIVSNPPYIPSNDIESLDPEVRREPRAALDGGIDGLDFYRAIFGRYRGLLKRDGFIALEIGFDQGAAIKELAAENGFDCRVIKDVGGNDRCALCRAYKTADDQTIIF